MRSANVIIGNAEFVARYEVNGRYFPPVLYGDYPQPPERPEIDLRQLTTQDGSDVSGLLEFDPVYDRVFEQVCEYERETNYGRDPDPDEAYERARDERMEAQ